MKSVIGLPVTLFIMGTFYQGFSQVKKNDTLLLQPIEIKAIRANDKAPFAKTNLIKKDIEKVNLGQDLPFILNQTPSVVINSDAGNGIGYTGIRIRGTDGTRINVTLNGIPYNDAESQISYFVDQPDIISSVNSIQVQRGVGTSSNGAGAFGATINLSTNEINDTAYAEINNSFGSFNTWKNTIKLGSGLLGKHFTIDARGSMIKSDGYIDRASSDLRSFFLSSAWLNAGNSLRFNVISGKEKTYQSWYGVPASALTANRTLNTAGTERPGMPYDNQTDNYWQTHYQLFYNQKINNSWAFNIASFLTRGYGYYEEYKAAQPFNNYGLPNFQSGTTTFTETDLIRRLWLDNYFYGTIFSLQQQTNKSQFTFGGGWNKYDGKHYGIVTWANTGFPKDHRYYDLTANKQEFNIYGKIQQQLNKSVWAFADLQARAIKYKINGFKYNPQLVINKDYLFINPKLGITYNKNNLQAFISYSLAGKEPNRDDFEAGTGMQPKAELLHDVETGIEKRTLHYSYGLTLYYMYYHNQLVLTGKINDVGAYTRTNTPSSYRAGIELQGKAGPFSWLSVSGNIAFSRNKIKNFNEYADDYDNGGQQRFQYHNTDISFSPGTIAGLNIDLLPVKNATFSFMSKYVGRQFLDNTSRISRSLNSFYTQDARLIFTLNKRIPKEINIILQANNIFNKKYEPNGYTFSYYYSGQLTTENYYFPMAGVNYMAGVNVRF